MSDKNRDQKSEARGQMTDTERLDFMQAHRVQTFRAETGETVALLGDCNPIASAPGTGRDLRAALDDCQAKNFDATGQRIRHKVTLPPAS
jgi:hypothetical protein